MSAKLAVVIGIVAAIGIVLGLSRRASEPTRTAEALPLVLLSDIPKILAMVTDAGSEGSFAVFLFGADGAPPAEVDALNVQFSIEKGRVGLDWVQLSPLNCATESRVRAFFDTEASPLSSHAKSGVNYLRTETGDLASLCRQLLTEVFGVSGSQKLELIAEGFAWRG